MNKWFLVVLTGLMTACGADTGSTKAGNNAVNGDQAKAAFEEAFEGMTVTEVDNAPMAGMV